MKDNEAEDVEGRFRRTRGGVTSFAAVSIKRNRRSPGNPGQVVLRLGPTQPGWGEVDRLSWPEWCAAAVQGAEAALLGLGLTDSVAITRIKGSPVDTTPDAIECAAGLAVARLFGQTEPEVSLDRPWRIVSFTSA